MLSADLIETCSSCGNEEEVSPYSETISDGRLTVSWACDNCGHTFTYDYVLSDIAGEA